MPDKDEQIRSTVAEIASIEQKIAETKALMADDPVIVLRKARLEEQIAEYQEGIKNLKRDLKLLIGEAAPPAKRAEKQAVPSEKRPTVKRTTTRATTKR